MDNALFLMQTTNPGSHLLSNLPAFLHKMEERLAQYRVEVRQELECILDYWMDFTVDTNHGGFIGRIDHANMVDHKAPKGSVLNSRILWSFSTAYNLTGKDEYMESANRAYNYLATYFIDKEFGGVYWTVDHKGQPLNTKKQIYALSFAVYALSEYYKASGKEAAKKAAISLYRDIVKHSYDQQFGGYIEALERNWEESKDLRLSAKDANEPKSMNTHLHVLEAFASLFLIWPDDKLRKEIKELVQLFLDHIISKNTHHLELFFDDEWNAKSKTVSYGHDIEAAWLVQEAAEVINDKLLLQRVKKYSLLLAQAAAKGLDADGGLWYEYEVEKGRLIKQKHSWPQAEAMVGFFNAWQVTGDEKYLDQSLRSWAFVQEFIKDKDYGEWKWGINEDYSTMEDEDKVGIWKCPYHNTRACMEIIKRISGLLKTERRSS